MELLEEQGCGYILGLPTNARLKLMGQPWCEDAATRWALSGKDKVRRFFQTAYQAASWSRQRRVAARVEATSRGADIRFIVTNLPGRAKLELGRHIVTITSPSRIVGALPLNSSWPCARSAAAFAAAASAAALSA
jgi:hypothetical protein